MNTKKQEAIRKAWLYLLSEEDFEKLALDEDGFSNYQCRRYIKQFRWDELYSRFRRTGEPKNGSDIIYRPKCLAGIENNNGWIAIEIEDDLPKDLTECYVYDDDGYITYFTFGIHDANEFMYLREQGITHYQPIIKPLPPIY